VRVPNAAIRFRPTTAMFAALGQEAPTDSAGRGSRLQADPGQSRLEPAATAAVRNDDVSVRPQTYRPVTATTVDALFGPLEVVQTDGRVWVYADDRLTPVHVRLGVSDGQTTEMIEGDLQPGTALVTNVTTGAEATTGSAPAGGLFMPGGVGGPGRQVPRR